MALDFEGKVACRFFTGPCGVGDIVTRVFDAGCVAFAGTEYVYVLASDESEARRAAGLIVPFRGDRTQEVIGDNLRQAFEAACRPNPTAAVCEVRRQARTKAWGSTHG